MFKKVTSAIVFAVIFVAIFFVWEEGWFAKVPQACEEPITYTLGIFDRRFGISQTDFLSALSEAEAIWEESIGQELFVYAPETAILPVNLIYDYRQETTETLSDLGNVLEENETTYNILQTRHAKLKTEYEKAKISYKARVEIFNEKNEAYQAQVDKWNKGPRTSKVQFNQLEEGRKALESEATALKNLEVQFNKVVQEINTLVDELNRLAKALNLNVKVYNTIGDSRGESFTGGSYYNEGGNQGIDIYEFSNRAKLVRVLAHELGHALGLDHNDDPEAIMYYLNKDDKKVLSETDLAELQALCYNSDVKN